MLLLENLLQELGARILYGINATDASVENYPVKEVICHTKSGRMEISAKLLSEATGRSDAADCTSRPYTAGSPQFAGLRMHITLAFKMANVTLVIHSEANKEWFFKAKTIGHVGSPRLLAEPEGKTANKSDLPICFLHTVLKYPAPPTTQENADIFVLTTPGFNCLNLVVKATGEHWSDVKKSVKGESMVDG